MRFRADWAESVGPRERYGRRKQGNCRNTVIAATCTSTQFCATLFPSLLAFASEAKEVEVKADQIVSYH